MLARESISDSPKITISSFRSLKAKAISRAAPAYVELAKATARVTRALTVVIDHLNPTGKF